MAASAPLGLQLKKEPAMKVVRASTEIVLNDGSDIVYILI
jgi:hypothetical protein